MADRDDGWTWIDAAQPRTVGDDERLDLARACARVFSGPDGERVMAHLRALTVERCLGPESGDAALRALEGQRQMVLHLLSLAALGRHGR